MLPTSIHPTSTRSGGWPADSAAEDHLIARSQAGDVQAFNLLVERYQQRVYAVCFRMLKNADAEDVTQEVFLAAFHAIRRYRGGSLIAWLLRIATNKSLDFLRAGMRRPAVSLDMARSTDAGQFEVGDPGEAPDEHVLRAELAHTLEQKLAELPPEQRLVIILSDIQGYSHEEIVTATGWPTGTVKSRLSRARARLRDTLRSRELITGV